MISVLSVKRITGNPADGIDNFNRAVFGRLRGEVNYRAGTPWALILGAVDIVWGNGGVRDALFLIFKPKRTRYVINWHTVLLKDEGLWRVRTPWLVRRFIFERANLIIAVSEFSAASVRRYFPHKRVVTVLNGVDCALFNPIKKDEHYLVKKYDFSFNKPLVIFVGACVSRKRPELFRALGRACSQAQFLVVGRGGDIESMPREDVAILFASAKAFVFPSLNEPSAAVILEAMASGCVPIVSASGGNEEFVKDGEGGFLIPVGTREKEAFLEKIGLLLNNKNVCHAMSRAAREEAERHSWDYVAGQYEKYVKEIIF